MWTLKAAIVAACVRWDRARTDVLRPGLFLYLPDDADARLVPNQPRPLVRKAEMRRHPIRSPRSLGFLLTDVALSRQTSVQMRERLQLARFGQGANFRFGQDHRTILSVNEFHYLTRC
jgi:hypothetical protein